MVIFFSVDGQPFITRQKEDVLKLWSFWYSLVQFQQLRIMYDIYFFNKYKHNELVKFELCDNKVFTTIYYCTPLQCKNIGQQVIIFSSIFFHNRSDCGKGDRKTCYIWYIVLRCTCACFVKLYHKIYDYDILTFLSYKSLVFWIIIV